MAVLSTSYPREPGDAAGHFVESEVTQLVQAGHDVHVVVPGTGASERGGATLHWLSDGDAFGWPGALTRLRERPQRAFGVGQFVLRARRALQRLGPLAHLQAHFLVPSAWPIAPLALGADRATELEIVGHGSDVRLFCGLPSWARARIARTWLRRGANLRVVSEELAQRLRRASPELELHVRVRQSPIEVRGVPRRDAARAALGIATDASVALVISRLVAEKRVSLALEALTLLEPLTVVVVGDGPESSALRARFPNVQFTGRLPREQALAWLAAADVLVSASVHEGAPTVVREARALGVPVVAVAAGDLADWATRDRGLWVLES